MVRINDPFVLITLMCSLVLSTTGCAWLSGYKYRDKPSDSVSKLSKQSVIQVPSHLATPDFEDLYPVPNAQNITGSSDLNDKLELKPPLPIEIIWGDQKVILKENKKNAWLSVKAPVDEVWELLLTFWASENIDLATPRAMANGVMITQWFNQPVFNDNPKKFEKVRLEISESQNEDFSEVALTFINKKADSKESLGSVEVDWAKQSSRSLKKKTRPFLIPLKAYLIDSLEKDKTVSLLEQAKESSPLVQIKKIDDTAVLFLIQDFNFAWAAIEDAVGSAELLVSDVDRSKGRIFLQLISNGTKSKLLKRLEKQRLLGMSNEIEVLILHITKQEDKVEVSVEDDQGQAVAYPIANFVLQLLVAQIGKTQ